MDKIEAGSQMSASPQQISSAAGAAWLHLFGLWAFAVAQPLFDVLSRNPEFFVARRSPPMEVAALAFVLSLAAPSAMVLVGVFSGLVRQPVRTWVHSSFVMALISIAVLTPLNQMTGAPGWAAIAAALVLGLGATAAYVRFRGVRQFMSVLSLAVVLFPAVFVFGSPVKEVIFPPEAAKKAFPAVGGSAPIVMVVFDELPLTSLLDENGQVDSALYPHFAELAGGSYWFRHATTVSAFTAHAIPPIVTGQFPQHNLPTAANYPENLFTLLGDSYDLTVIESQTQLCPDTLCTDLLAEGSLGERMYSLLWDVGAVYLALIVPPDMSDGLPDVTRTWGEFKARKVYREAGKALDPIPSIRNRVLLFRRFLDSLGPSGQPNLYFLHVNLPHWPWEYLPSGRTYGGGTVHGLAGDVWQNEWALIQAFQRHLLQVGYTDKLLGDLMAKLKSVGLYDSSLLVITADHGSSFRLNDHYRHVSDTNISDIMAVPLFIKLPHQREGVLSKRPVQLIDVLPTMLDALGIPPAWKMDGVSAIADEFPERSRLTMSQGVDRKFYVAPADVVRSEALKWKLDLLGSAGTPDRLFRIGPQRHWIGRRVDKSGITATASPTVTLEHATVFDHIQRESDFIPTRIEAAFTDTQETGSPLRFAIAVNGTIRAVTEARKSTGQGGNFSAIVPESAFEAGRNRVEVFQIANGSTGQTELRRLKMGAVENAAPSIRSVSPNPVTANSAAPGPAINVIGSNFHPEAQIRFNSEDAVHMIYASSRHIAGRLPERLLVRPATIRVTVENPGGEISNSVPLEVDPQASGLRIEVLHPPGTIAGKPFNVQPSGASAIAVEGAGFEWNSSVQFNQKELKTTFGGTTLLTAFVPKEFVAQPGVIKVTVRNAGGDLSNEKNFVISKAPGGTE